MKGKLYSARIMSKLILGFMILTCCAVGSNAALSEEADEPGTVPYNSLYDAAYRVSEYLDDESFDEYLHGDDSLFRRVLSFQDGIRRAEDFRFIPFSCNPTEIIGTTIPEQCLVNYGTEFAEDSSYEIEGEAVVAAEAIQITESFFDLFPVTVAEGRSFTDQDYDFIRSGRIPVILGAAYRDSFHVGDTFEGYYIFDRFTFEVIGFAESGGFFYYSGVRDFVSYDGYMIMPFAAISEDSPFGRIVLLQEICGYMIAENGRESAVEAYLDCLTSAGLRDWIGRIGIYDTSLEQERQRCNAVNRLFQ